MASVDSAVSYAIRGLTPRLHQICTHLSRVIAVQRVKHLLTFVSFPSASDLS